MRFIVVQVLFSGFPEDGLQRQTMVNVEAIRTIYPCKEDGAGAAILFTGHPDATMFVAEDFEVLRARLRDLELPMPGCGS